MDYEWDFAGGEAEYKKAFQLDPNDATAHYWYASDVSLLGGSEQEAIAEAQRAYQLEPLSPITTVVVGLVYTSMRQYDQAIQACKKSVTENPTYADAHRCLAFAYCCERRLVTLYRILGREQDARAMEFKIREQFSVADADHPMLTALKTSETISAASLVR